VSAGVRVLVVDDEPSYREGLQIALGAEGFVVDVAADGEEALAMFEALEPEIVLLDVMLPRLSGIDVCRRIRSLADTPVIMVSARREEIDTVVGLEVGADDYVAKPYRVRELVARMRTVMRRSRTRPIDYFNGVANLSIGDVTVDRDRHEVTIGGQLERLPLKEFEVLALLMEKGAAVRYHDPQVPQLRLPDGQCLHSQNLDAAELAAADCVVVITDHSAIDWQQVADHSALVVDTRHVVVPLPGAARVLSL